MNTKYISGEKYSVALEYDEHSLSISNGNFGEISIIKNYLFELRLKNTRDGICKTVKSNGYWARVSVIDCDSAVKLCFAEPEKIGDVEISVKAENDGDGISWSVEVINENPEWSVMNITYPTPSVTAEKFALFIPDGCGIVIPDAGKSSYSYNCRYPGGNVVMQYFAAYGENDGVYIGIEDGEGAVKEFDIGAGSEAAKIKATFYGINASVGANSFSVFGKCRWQYIKGDWYDATLLYSDFVKRGSDWLPKIASDGRTDTSRKFKEIPFWVSDYIPNIPSQGLNKPMSLSAGSDLYDKDYWIDAVIELQKQLETPIAYHVYNWHKIPFNIEYPHFLPAKEEFIEGAKRLREKPIYILPYINAGSWEMHDAEMGHAVNFENTGSKGAVITEDGGFVIEHYPQTTLKGETSLLANMCPSSKEWNEVIGELAYKMERELPIDGIYFDQIGAINASPCYNAEHGHTLGGGAYWAKSYRAMMENIRVNKPKDNFYFTENNEENLANCYDGFLTWTWVQNMQVPAFPAVYAGYIEMLGRCTIGKKKEDVDFFKFSLAESLLYGQQLGWCKADTVYDEKRMPFLKKTVKLRYQYTELFHCSDLMRPPKVTSSIPAKITAPALNYTDDIVMEQVLAGAWRYRKGDKLVIFCANVSGESGEFSLSFSADEYGLQEFDLPEDFVINGDTCRVSGGIPAESYKVWELNKK